MPCSRRNCARTYYRYSRFRSSQALGTPLKFSELLVPLHSSPRPNQHSCPKVSASDTKICRFFKNLQISAYFQKSADFCRFAKSSICAATLLTHAAAIQNFLAAKPSARPWSFRNCPRRYTTLHARFGKRVWKWLFLGKKSADFSKICRFQNIVNEICRFCRSECRFEKLTLWTSGKLKFVNKFDRNQHERIPPDHRKKHEISVWNPLSPQKGHF